MAGITNVAFRQLCREHGAGIYVCEMVMTRALVERNEKTLRMVNSQATKSRAASSCTEWIPSQSARRWR